MPIYLLMCPGQLDNQVDPVERIAMRKRKAWQGGGACEFELCACADARGGRGLGSGGLVGQVGVCGCGLRLGAVSGSGGDSEPALLMAARCPPRSYVEVEGHQVSVATARRAARLGSLGRVPSAEPRTPRSWPLGHATEPLAFASSVGQALNLSALSFHIRNTAVK